MARQAGVSVEQNFSRGLITEATGLNFPENACTETYDCIFDKTGEVYRRYGIQLEDNFEVHDVDDLADSAITEFVWKTAALDGELTFLTIQVGSIISFWQIDTDGVASPNLKDFSIDLNDYKTSGSPQVKDVHCSFASGNGQLFIAHPYCETTFTEYDRDTDDITTKQVNLKVRDMWGLPNTLPNTDTPIDASHRPSNAEFGSNQYYNLLNRGWGELRYCTFNRKIFQKIFPLTMWRYTPDQLAGGQTAALFMAGLIYMPAIAGINPFSARSDWPSDADQIELMKQPMIPFLDEDGNVLPPIPPTEAWSLLAVDEALPGNSPAPRGRFIYDAFRIDRDAKMREYASNQNPGGTAIAWINPATDINPYIAETIEIETSGYARPSQVTFFAGRVWYAGVDAPKYNQRIFFSKIIEGNQHIDECYQQQDPSSDFDSTDLLAADGGMIVIPDIQQVVKLFAFGSNLLVFATNGIWKISGSSEGAGFDAVSYSISRISSIGAISALSFVDTDGTPLWWNGDGIYSIKQDGLTAPQAISLTNSTIQTFYDAIPVTNRRYVKGAFNKNDKTVKWIYRSTEFENVQERYMYDRVMNLDLNTGAFYPWTISDSCLYVSGVVVLDGFGAAVTEEVVTDDAVDVTDGGDDVTNEATTLADISARYKFLVFNECDSDTGTPSTDASLTYNRNFYGSRDFADVSSDPFTVMNTAQNAFIKGEDGKYYTSYAVETGDDATNITLTQHNSDGTAVAVRYPLTQFTLDINNELGSSFATFAYWYKIYPVPYTPYFYVMHGQGYGELLGAVVAGLYKINSSGAIVFQNAAQRWNGSYIDAFFFGATGHGYTRACDYESYAESYLDRPLLIVNMTSVAGMYVYRLPSINDFIADSGFVGTVAANLWTGYADTYPSASGGASLYSVSGGIFILPTTSGARLYRYVNWATAQAHLGEVAFKFPSITALAPANPTGFVMSSPINSVNWTLANSSFKDSSGNALVPFADVLLDRDGTDPGYAAEDYKNDWMAPTHQYDEDTNTHYLVWNRAYRPVELNQTSIGTYRSVLVQTWNPSSEIATEIVSPVAGNPFDSLADLTSSDRYGSYAFDSQAFLDLGTNEVFVYSWYPTPENPGRNSALAKFADFVPGTPGEPGIGLMSFGEFSNPDFIDWSGVTAGEDYTSYFISGYKTRGEALRKFQSNYMNIFTRNSNPSTFDVYGRWDFAASGNTGRWNTVQRVTQSNTDYTYRHKRLKMRGHGKTLNFKISSIPQEPFNLIGWSIFETTNASP